MRKLELLCMEYLLNTMFEDPTINPRILLSVGKVIIAIAWADGEIQDEEIECLRALLTELPDIPPEYIQALESLLKRPIEPTEREIILDEFTRLITRQAERNFALYWLDRILSAKGERHPLETQLYDNVVNRFLTLNKDKSLLGTEVESEQIASPKNAHEKALQDIESAFNQAREFIDKDLLSDILLRRMLMLGVLAARITLADYRIDESEVEQLRDFVRRQTGLDKSHALELARLILVYDLDDDTEVLALCRELKALSSPEERNHWLDQLLKISEQDGIIVEQEMNQIISIAAALGVNQAHFQRMIHNALEYTED